MEKVEAVRILRAHEADLKKMGVKRLYMFGSTVRGEQKADSDIDLFFDFDEGTLGLGLIDIQEAASRFLGCKADVVTRGSLHKLIRQDVEATAVPVF
jgi:predicted nucleotidyltransferase